MKNGRKLAIRHLSRVILGILLLPTFLLFWPDLYTSYSQLRQNQQSLSFRLFLLLGPRHGWLTIGSMCIWLLCLPSSIPVAARSMINDILKKQSWRGRHVRRSERYKSDREFAILASRMFSVCNLFFFKIYQQNERAIEKRRRSWKNAFHMAATRSGRSGQKSICDARSSSF